MYIFIDVISEVLKLFQFLNLKQFSANGGIFLSLNNRIRYPDWVTSVTDFLKL